MLKGTLLVDALNERIEQGLIRKSISDDGLTVYSYSEQCTFSRAWDNVTMEARGLILNDVGTIVSWPLRKFFNSGEPCCPEPPRGEGFEVFEKVDGSFLQIFNYQGQWRMATRGSFRNEYITFAEKYLPMAEKFPPNWTVLCEVCLPAELDPMPRCVQHEPGLYLLGARDKYSGHDMLYDRCLEYWGGKTVKRYGAVAIEELLEQAKTLEGAEGWVVRWDSGQRMKVKSGWFMKLFRAISALNENHIKELIMDRGFENVVVEFPEELQVEAENILNTIKDRFDTKMTSIMNNFKAMRHPDRKTFALRIKDNPDRAFLFNLYDLKDITRDLVLRC